MHVSSSLPSRHHNLSFTIAMALARLVLLLFLSSFVVHGAKIQYTNTTVDDTDSSIRYIGSWDKSANTDLNFGGSHALSTQKTAEAFFTFTGTRFIFIIYISIDVSKVLRYII